MFKLFLFVAFLAFAAAAPGALLAPALSYSAYSAPVYSGIHAAPAYTYNAYAAAPVAYGYGGISAYGYKSPAYLAI